MDASSKDPRYADWSKNFADGTPMTTEHYGFAKYFEGCLNSPVRAVSLMRAGAKFPANARAGWVEVTVPRVLVHEAVRVDLG